MGTPDLVIFSDVHLVPGTDLRTGRLLHFLDRLIQRRIPKVYILGDFFEVWVGPRHFIRKDYNAVLSRLARLANQSQVTFLHGNRDYTVGRSFEKRLGIRVVPDYLVIQSGNKRIYMAHGDMFCADDHLYRFMRGIIRGAPCRFVLEIIPLDLLMSIAETARNISQKEIARKTERTLRLSDELVMDVFKQGFDVCVLGHVHKAQIIPFKSGARACSLVTLGHWDTGISYIEITDGDLHLYEGSPGNFHEISANHK